ncbi:melanoma-associated antigen B10-like [Lepus europaeus]|uniref:melanoma-associated antigen B10-like n=1 Tax=Lepus europaeus TaxID=9983 RepID=UPI002B461B55|nr:melanoma-associated antigen B10-like [Lepus europaeus]
MPRGRKSKLRAQAKRRQAQEEPQNLVSAQATAGVTERAHSSSSNRVSTPQRSTASGATSTTAAAVSHARYDNQVRERPTSSQAQVAFGHLCSAPLDENVVTLVQYLLLKYQMKEPIWKADVMRNIIRLPKSHFHEILMKASEYMELIFGLDIRKLDPNRHIYVLINKLDISYDAKLGDDEGIPKTGLLMTILGVIFARGNCATEEQIWQILNIMGIYDGRRHFIFGDPRKLITEDLVKAKYLIYREVPNTIPPRHEFLWGPRAYAETSKMKVLEFLAKVHDIAPTAFTSWYAEALRDEEERARTRAAARARIRAIADARSRALLIRPSHTSKV